VEESGSNCIAYPHHNIPPRMPANVQRCCWVSIENRGTEVWQRDLQKNRSVGLAIYLNNEYSTGWNSPKLRYVQASG
jgi:hypothetical protein